MNPGYPTQRANLIASSLALLIASLGVAVGLWYCEHLEERYIHALAPEFSDEKLQGVALQREAFSQPDLLVLYGSSELVKPIPNNANEFFEDYPTGFRVFPVGKNGTTALTVLQKVAAVGEGVKGRKVAYSISPGSYFYEVYHPVTGKPLVLPKYYKGNFSKLQASELVFTTRLSRTLKRDIARRMLEFPETLQGHQLLETALECLAQDRPVDHARYAFLRPVGLLDTAIGRAQDHVETAMYILEEEEKLDPTPDRVVRSLNWKDMVRKAALFVNANVVPAKKKQAAGLRPKVPQDQTFLTNVARAGEWKDVELLMRTLKELGAQPLLLSMPLEDLRLEAGGWSPNAREVFARRLDNLADRYRCPLIDFRDHEKDPEFMIDLFDHLSAKGWLYYNKALDDFHHGRISTL